MSQNQAPVDSHDAIFEFSKKVIKGEGYNFLGSRVSGGQDFWAVYLRGAKIFGPSPLKKIPPLSPPPPPPIVHDRSLINIELPWGQALQSRALTPGVIL